MTSKTVKKANAIHQTAIVVSLECVMNDRSECFPTHPVATMLMISTDFTGPISVTVFKGVIQQL